MNNKTYNKIKSNPLAEVRRRIHEVLKGATNEGSEITIHNMVICGVHWINFTIRSNNIPHATTH